MNRDIASYVRHTFSFILYGIKNKSLPVLEKALSFMFSIRETLSTFPCGDVFLTVLYMCHCHVHCAAKVNSCIHFTKIELFLDFNTKARMQYPGIKSIQFVSSSILFVHLDNVRTFIVPLEKFPALKNLSDEQKRDFEIIDDKYLSFLSIDEVFSIEELIGI